MATVTATPGSERKLPAAYVQFRITEKAQMDAIVVNSTSLNNSYYTLHEKNRYAGDLQVSYYFLTGGDSDYSGMAARYRELLPETGGASAGTPLVAELVGVVDVTENMAGVSVRRERLLTSLEDVRTIAGELQAGGAKKPVGPADRLSQRRIPSKLPAIGKVQRKGRESGESPFPDQDAERERRDGLSRRGYPDRL